MQRTSVGTFAVAARGETACAYMHLLEICSGGAAVAGRFVVPTSWLAPAAAGIA